MDDRAERKGRCRTLQELSARGAESKTVKDALRVVAEVVGSIGKYVKFVRV